MTKVEYESIQNDLSHKLRNVPFLGLNRKEREAYEKAVLACKSILSKYNPNKEMQR